MVRLSGLFAAKPAANKAEGARYYATDRSQVYFSTGGQWVLKDQLDEDDAEGQSGGATIADRPSPNTCIGYIWTDAATGNQYEAFPGAWALINDTTMGAVIHGAVTTIARPTGYACITWIGSVEPVNAANYDIWEEV